MENLLTVAEAARRLQITPRTVRLHLKRGLLRGKKQGRQWRIFESALAQTNAAERSEQGAVHGREVKVYAASGALSDALSQIAAARALLTTGAPMDASRELALLRGEPA